MAGEHGLTAKPFTVDIDRHTQNVVTAIKEMENNKAVGTDGVHVEILKPNARKAAELLIEIWRLVGKYSIVPNDWLEGITVPLI